MQVFDLEWIIQTFSKLLALSCVHMENLKQGEQQQRPSGCKTEQFQYHGLYEGIGWFTKGHDLRQMSDPNLKFLLGCV